MKKSKKNRGFTLLEMILVIAIISSILLLITRYASERMNQYRRDRAAAQMQQILNAGLSYYVNNGTWPVPCTTTSPIPAANLSILNATSSLVTSNYLPPTITSIPFLGNGNAYQIGCTTANTSSNPITGSYFQVTATVYTLSDAEILAGELPIAQFFCQGATCASGTNGSNPPYTVAAQVQVPGQNLNNARSVNFGGIYHHGACVPVPTCPTGMQPEILVAPASVAGVNDAPTTGTTAALGGACNSTTIIQPDGTTSSAGSSPCTAINQYPITSFAAYATAQAVASTDGGPLSCNSPPPPAPPIIEPCYTNIPSAGSAWGPLQDNNLYWRVCLQIVTEKGPVTPPPSTFLAGASQNSYGLSTDNQYLYWTYAMGTILATTRCVPSNSPGEPSGSDLTVPGY